MTGANQQFLEVMADVVTGVLPRFDERTGRFLSEPDGPPAPGAKPEDMGWAVVNQDIIYALALLYVTPGTAFHRDATILDTALRGGDAIRDSQYPDGRVEFLKVDGSRWGPTYMCWTNYAWLEAYALLRDRMDETRRRRWKEGLTLAHDGQAREIRSLHVHNISCWKAMSCYRGGQIFARPDWQEAGTAMIRAVTAAQQPGGYWAEHGGPTTSYNVVYVQSLGLYHAFTGDESLLPVLEAATDFHQAFLYPSGVRVETIDGRVKYRGHVGTDGWVGFSTCPRGRRLVRYQAERLHIQRNLRGVASSSMASAVQHVSAGEEAPINLDRASFREMYGDLAVLCRDGPWFACLSAFTCRPVASRWGQDRQAFLSLWHDGPGLLLGGGNSKNQAEWASFVADGRFVPDKGEILPGGSGVGLTYGTVRCLLRLQLEGRKVVIEGAAEGGPALQQFVVQAKKGDRVRSAAGHEATLDEPALHWDASKLGAWIEVKGHRITVAPGAEFRWPTVPFNPYSTDGAAAFGSEAGVLSARIDGQPVRWEVEAQ